MPADNGMAFVLIQHLDPKHQSMMVDLLTGHTPMQVLQAADRMPLERDHVYLIPPGAYLAIRDGVLRLSKPLERHGARMPFDFFLRSLAEECGERAICAILSGTGTDGSLGLKAVKEKGGLVIVQDPQEAAFDGMPRSAIGTGGADLVLTVAQIPQALARYSRQRYVKDGDKGLRPGRRPGSVRRHHRSPGREQPARFLALQAGNAAAPDRAAHGDGRSRGQRGLSAGPAQGFVTSVSCSPRTSSSM